MQDASLLSALVELILPQCFVDYFKVVEIQQDNCRVDIYLDELFMVPEDRSGHKIESKGFLEAVTIQDYPLRDKRVTFHVRRRKWYDADNSEYFTNSYDLVAEGTRYSKEFAAFLKELPRDIPRIGSLA